jgi:hypothetical protein
MTLRDVLLVLGAMPLLGVVVLRLSAEMGLGGEAPPAEALSAGLAIFGFVFLVYVALTLRSIARATRQILARESEDAPLASARAKRRTAVSDFAIHLDRSAEIDLRDGDTDSDAAAGAEPPGEPGPPSAAPRQELFGEVSDLLTRIPSARSR